MARRYRDPNQGTKDTILYSMYPFLYTILVIFALNVSLLFVLPEMDVKPTSLKLRGS